ncbi:DUF305 domain-containing protein [Cellulomonas endophytica]|uniref:DUF305 domain-containing protein n=1 Tax=Cellulomonas endophytica TaxID=2494735 RepID=UPI001011CCFA|nr:DUF305 domain-containing protein [Cellulomonas endophytica]
MQTRMRRAMAGTTAAALALTLAACSSSEQGSGSTTAASAPASSQSAVADVHNEADTGFAQMMIEHHNGALDMANLAVEKGSTSEIQELGQRIADAQGPEIDLMTGWLEAWGEETSADMSMEGMDHSGMEMDGMSMDEAMTELESLSGAEFDRRFLELMIAHHTGAIDMAQQEIEDGSDPEAIQLAQDIVEAQTAEIDEMQQMLDAMA